jgi:hypothetical protein
MREFRERDELVVVLAHDLCEQGRSSPAVSTT